MFDLTLAFKCQMSQKGKSLRYVPSPCEISRLKMKVGSETHEAIQKIQVMNKKARTEMMDPMIEVPNARMKKMYAPPRKRVHSDTKSVYLNGYKELHTSSISY